MYIVQYKVLQFFNIIVNYIYENVCPLQISFTGKKPDDFKYTSCSFFSRLSTNKTFSKRNMSHCPIDQMFNDDINYYVLVLFRKNDREKIVLYVLQRKR